jgi:hypothetical protein
MFCVHLYESLACSFGGAGGGNTSTGAGINDDETVFGGLSLLENLYALGSAFGVGRIIISAAGGTIGSGFGFFVLMSHFSFTSSCSSFAKFFLRFWAAVRELRFHTRNLSFGLLDFRAPVRHRCPQT